MEKILAIADPHGHPELVENLLDFVDEAIGKSYAIVPMGDYCDNGPSTPDLVDLLLDLSKKRGDNFHPIMGNHDLAFCLATGFVIHPAGSDRWIRNYYRNYPNSRLVWTPVQYYLRNAKGIPRYEALFDIQSLVQILEENFPTHLAFFTNLPWCMQLSDYFFVHAGMYREDHVPWVDQVAYLGARDLGNFPPDRTWLPFQFRGKRRDRNPDGKEVALSDDPRWPKTVVSAHSAMQDPVLVGKKRIWLNAIVDKHGPLVSILLPENRVFLVMQDGTTAELEPEWKMHI